MDIDDEFSTKGLLDPKQRPVDWRWQYAAILNGQGAREEDNMDPWVRRLLRFLRMKYDPTTTDAKLERKFRDLYNADMVYSEPGKLRSYIEALLLCRDLTLKQIAQELFFPLKDVEAYTNCCFDVRGFLDRPMEISWWVFGAQFDRSRKQINSKRPTMDLDMQMKRAAYKCRVGSLGALMGYRSADPETIRQWLQEDHAQAMELNDWAASRGIQLNEFNVPEIISEYEEHRMRLHQEKVDSETHNATVAAGSEIFSIKLTMAEVDTDATGVYHEPRLAERMASQMAKLNFRIASAP